MAITAGTHRAKRKAMTWTAMIRYPGKPEIRIGNVVTTGYQPKEAKRLLQEMAERHLPPGFAIGWWGRGRLEYIDEGE